MTVCKIVTNEHLLHGWTIEQKRFCQFLADHGAWLSQYKYMPRRVNLSTWRAAEPTRHVSICHFTSVPAFVTRSLSFGQLATWSYNNKMKIKLCKRWHTTKKCSNDIERLIPTLVNGNGLPLRLKIARQSPAFATKSLFLTIRAVTAVHPGCQSFWIILFDFRWRISSSRNAKSVLTNASERASVGLKNAELRLTHGKHFRLFAFNTNWQTLHPDQIAWEIQGLLGQKIQQLLNLWKVFYFL